MRSPSSTRSTVRLEGAARRGYRGMSQDFGQLLAQIQAGKSLKKAEERAPAPAPASGGRDGLLAEIASGGFKLKKVEAPAGGDSAKLAPKAPANDLAATLANAMAGRRAAQAGSDSEDDSDWDD